jgi:threonine/homoserine/homoserine lactone efflux protein
MIIDPGQLWLFIPAALALNLTPGADMMFCLGQGARHGPRAGVAAAFGITTGGMVHAALAALGLAAFLTANPAMFAAVRWGGALYLLWLAFGAVRAAPPPEVGAAIPGGHAFRDAMVVSLLNPKVAFFILAFVPQFVDPARGAPGLQFLIFGLIIGVGGVCVNGLVGAFAGRARRRLAGRGGGAAARALRWGTAVLFAGLAARIAFDRG